ncbi:ABC transporter permease [Sphingobium sp. Sx8-8]|uniref:ABC transporter permease n=1 Tax=Sphingobium sp. Sx8-8 TaxID=2933617 RepID=UPI001F59FC24|nr:ABC transporter permease [Sphingobium sp. Sx8-8]
MTQEDKRDYHPFLAALSIQFRVIGALIMRELHTRYGRENIGYLWMILEPALLAAAIAAFHSGSKNHYSTDILPVPFTIVGYTAYYMFRAVVNRAEGTIESNQSLLYHRRVTILDLSIARTVLEFISVLFTMILLLTLAALFGLGDMPYRWIYLLGGFILMTWFCFGLALIVTSWTYDNRTAARLVHPMTYLALPLSGAFVILSWVPEPYRSLLYWFPMVQIFEMIRYGQFEYAESIHFDMLYIILICALLTYTGLILMRRLRHHIHLR